MTDFWEKRGQKGGVLATEPTASDEDRAKEEAFRKKLLAWTHATMKREGLLPSRHLLDLGCGIGDLSATVRRECKRLTLVDGAQAMVEQARDTMKATHHKHWRALQADLATFDGIEPDVDLVYAGAACMYLDDDAYVALLGRIAAKAHRAVAIVEREYVAMNGGPTGVVIDGELQPDPPPPPKKDEYRSYRRSVEQYAALAERAGFHCTLVRYGSDVVVEHALGSWGRLASVVRPVGRFARRTKHEGSATFVLRRS